MAKNFPNMENYTQRDKENNKKIKEKRKNLKKIATKLSCKWEVLPKTVLNATFSAAKHWSFAEWNFGGLFCIKSLKCIGGIFEQTQ